MKKSFLNKKFIMVLSLFLVFIMLGAASAATNDTMDEDSDICNDVLTVEETVEDENEVLTDVDDDSDVLLDDNSDSGSFSELNEYIQENSDFNKTIELNEDYLYDETTDVEYKYGIALEGYLTIDGQGHTLDGNGSAAFFNLLGSNTVLKNIVFKNGYTNGDAPVNIIGENCQILNSTFINCTSTAYGGAISVRDTALNTVIANSEFLNNYKKGGGGSAIFVYCNHFLLENLSFTNNTCYDVSDDDYEYGALYISQSSRVDAIEARCRNLSFTNNYGEYGSAITVRYLNNVLFENITLINNTGETGIIYATQANNLTFKNINLINNSASSYGSMYFTGTCDNVNINKVKFINNFAISGSAIAVAGNGTFKVNNSDFSNNQAKVTTIKISDNCTFMVYNSNFVNNTVYSSTPISNREFNISSNVRYVNNGINEISELLNITDNNVTVDLENKEYIVLASYTISNNFTTINGNGAVIDMKNQKNIFLKISYVNNILIENLIIKNGFNDASAAAIKITNVTNLTIKNVTFIDNEATNAPAIYITQSTNVSILDSIFISNNASEQGGAIYVTKTNDNVIINGSSFENNSASTNGGSLYLANNATIVDYCEFTSNSADNGGAIYQNSDTPRVYNSEFTYNMALYNPVSNVLDNMTDSEFNNLFSRNYLNPLAYVLNIEENSTIELCSTDVIKHSALIEINVSNVVINGNGAIFDGESLHQILYIHGLKDNSINNITLENMIIKNGLSENDYSAIKIAYVNNLTIRNVTFINNVCLTGAAIYITQSNNISIINSNFKSNTAKNESGDLGRGLIQLTATAVDCIIDNCTFNKNIVNKGVIYGNINETTIISNCNLTNNIAYSSLIQSTKKHAFSVLNCTIMSNIVYNNKIFVNEDNAILEGNTIYGEDFITLFYDVSENMTVTLNGGEYDSYSPIVISADNVVIDGNGSTINGNRNSVFIINATNVTVKNINIINAYSTSANFISLFINSVDGASKGAAILFNGNATVINSTFINNSASDFGGALYFYFDGVVIDSTFVGNSINHTGSARDAGAAIYFEGNGTIINSTFEDNNAYQGGAVTVVGDAKVYNSSFNNNSAVFGGATYFKSTSETVNSNFTNNSAICSAGASYSKSDSNVTNSSYAGNTAETGGAIVSMEKLSVSESSFDNNSALVTGAISNAGESTISNSAFDGNNATYGASVDLAGDNTVISNVTVNNDASAVAIVVSGDNSTISDSTVSNVNGTAIAVSGNGTNVSGVTLNNVSGNAVVVAGDNSTISNVSANGGNGTVVVTSGSNNNVSNINTTDYNGTSNATVEKNVMGVELPDVIHLNEDVNMSITLDKDVNGTVEITIDGVSQNVTLSEGKYVYSIDTTSLGSFNLTVCYIPSAYYEENDNYTAVYRVQNWNFTELQEAINEAINSNKTDFDLEHDYICEEGEETIKINDPININGNGHTINANNASGVFDVYSENVTIADVNISNVNGTAIVAEGDNITVDDVNLSNVSGDAIVIKGNNTKVSDVTSNNGTGNVVDITGSDASVSGVEVNGGEGTAVTVDGDNATVSDVSVNDYSGTGVKSNGTNAAISDVTASNCDNITVVNSTGDNAEISDVSLDNVNGTGIQSSGANAVISNVSANGGNGTVVNSTGYNSKVSGVTATNHTGTTVVETGDKITSITASNAVVYINSKYVVTVNNKVAGKTVTLKINGVSLSATTDSNGKATFTLTKAVLASVGVKSATINFAAQGNYLASSKTVKLTVKSKLTMTAKSVKKSYKKSKTKKIKITLKDSFGKGVTGKVIIKAKKIKGKIGKKLKKGYKVKIKNGKLTLKLPAKKAKFTKKGKYTFKITFKKTTYYDAVSKKLKLKVK